MNEFVQLISLYNIASHYVNITFLNIFQIDLLSLGRRFPFNKGDATVGKLTRRGTWYCW